MSSRFSVLLRACAQHSVHPTGGSLRVFRQFAWLEVGSGKTALSRPAHPRVTHAVGRQTDRGKNWYSYEEISILVSEMQERIPRE